MAVPIMQPIPAPTPVTLPDILKTGLGLGTQIQQFRALPQVLRQAATQRAAATALTQAQTELARQKASQAAAGVPERYAPGGAGIVQGLEQIKKEYGEDSPQYQMASHFAQVASTYQQERGNYYNANVAMKYMTPLMKDQLALQIQRESGRPLNQIRSELNGDIPPEPMSIAPEGAFPGSTNTIHNPNSQAHVVANTYISSPKEKQEAQDQIEQTEGDISSRIGVTTARNQLTALVDIAKTINAIDIKPVTKYSGVQGKSQATMQRAAAALNLPVSDDFVKYNRFINTQRNLIADAARQALATSVREGYVRSFILPLIDVSTWTENPKLALDRFNFFKQWINDKLRVTHHLAAKGVPPTVEELDKVLGIGMPPISPASKPFPTPTATPTIAKKGLYLGKYTDKDLEETAKTHNMTVDEVKRQLGIQ